MAFQKKYEIKDSGVQVDYMQLESVYFDQAKSLVYVTFRMYKDKASRDAGKKPLDSLTIPLADAEASSLLTAAYNYLKTVESLNDVTDV